MKDARPRAILTEFGEVASFRRVYIDEFGDRRTHLAEERRYPSDVVLDASAVPGDVRSLELRVDVVFW